ncbi:VanZ family protein [Christensenellaceae bacterium OttesenSCG-928-M15]|nr:VanZ family protein [Christensenellaceae bacterium OttesenSCG-928-M15]
MIGYVYETFAHLLFYLPFLLAFILCVCFFNKKHGVQTPPLHIAGCFLFMLYITVVLNITGTWTLYDILLRGFSIGEISLVLFSDVRAFGFIMNIVLFLPLGFFLPLLFQGKNKFRSAALHGFLFSFAIETSQLFNLRTTDIDDLIANSLGAMLGFFLYRLLFRRKTFLSFLTTGENAYTKREPALIIVFLFLLRFFLMPLLYEIVYT